MLRNPTMLMICSIEFRCISAGWLSFDPHPPIYFMISRLRKLDDTAAEIKQPLIRSAEDVTEGFFDSLS
jgi:hypothetical protein